MLTFAALAQPTNSRLTEPPEHPTSTSSRASLAPARPGALALAVSGGLGAALLTALLVPSVGLAAGSCLASLFGVAGGLVAFGAQRLLRLLPGARLAQAGVGALLGYWCVAVPLGAWQKLQGGHPAMALATLLGSLSWGAGLAASLRWYGSADAPQKKRWRIALATASALAGVLLGMLEATQSWLRSYAAARWALFGSAWWCAALATGALLSGVLARRERILRALAFGLVGAAFLVVTRVPASTWSALARAPHAENWVRLARALTDFDGDGFSHWFGGGDCGPFDAQVSPRAREIPGNGIDDNCHYGDAPRPVASVAGTAYGGLPAPTLNVVLVTIDALRADHTQPYGYPRPSTPNLQAFAASSVRFDNAYTSGGWTCLALPSVFSGLYPRRLSWRPVSISNQRVLDFPWQGKLAPGEHLVVTLTLPAAPPPWWLPSVLRSRGYTTIAAGNHGVSRIARQGLAFGWDHVILEDSTEEDAATLDALLPKLAEQKAPFFVWLHLYDAHDPQTQHPGAPQFGSSMLDRYDHEVASADLQLGRLLRALEGHADTAWIVTADHGEAFQGGFQFHGTDLNEDSIRIPLLLRAPGLAPSVNVSPASLVDIAPTLLALTGTPQPGGLDGRDLRRLRGDEPVLTDLFRVDEHGNTTVDQLAATTSRLRLVRDQLTQVDTLVRTGDLARPPRALPQQLVAPQLLESLGRYQESLGP